MLTLPAAAMDEEKCKYFSKKFSGFCRKINSGDRNVFDRFCQKIYPFCIELYEFTKDLSFDHESLETPCDFAIYDVGSEMASSIIPIYKNYLTKSE
jgi:hypothetical protein